MTDKNDVQHNAVPTHDEVLRQIAERLQALDVDAASFGLFLGELRRESVQTSFSPGDIMAAFEHVFEPVTLESYFDFLDDGETIRIKGHRIGLDLILESYKDGHTPEQIAKEFGSIRLEDVFAAITYYLHNQDRLDAWLADINAWVQDDIAQHDTHPSPAAERLRKLAQAQKQTRRAGQASA